MQTFPYASCPPTQTGAYVCGHLAVHADGTPSVLGDVEIAGLDVPVGKAVNDVGMEVEVEGEVDAEMEVDEEVRVELEVGVRDVDNVAVAEADELVVSTFTMGAGSVAVAALAVVLVGASAAAVEDSAACEGLLPSRCTSVSVQSKLKRSNEVNDLWLCTPVSVVTADFNWHLPL